MINFDFYNALFFLVKKISFRAIIRCKMYKQMVNKGLYNADCPCQFGKYAYFTDYIKNFAKNAKGHGLDVGAGPNGPNGSYFKECERLDGCDIDEKVSDSLPSQIYKKKFVYNMGVQKLPYNQSLDFIVCSCVIHHLESDQLLREGLKQLCRALKKGGSLFLLYKTGNHDTDLTVFNKHFKQYRKFRVFNKNQVNQILRDCSMEIMSQQILGDENWVSYINTIASKK